MAASLDILLGEVFSCFAASFMVTHCSGCSGMGLTPFLLILDILPSADSKCNNLKSFQIGEKYIEKIQVVGYTLIEMILVYIGLLQILANLFNIYNHLLRSSRLLQPL